MAKKKRKQPSPWNARGLLLPMKKEVLEALKEHCADKPEGLERWAVGVLICAASEARLVEELHKMEG